ncbi:unnamed protein product [Didymodactylos carnosus]|uniref:Uncharacterized protein n=1 Tax=Didymodactylos carnosus TaxID=1234261 RepID=A0A8S2SLM7_9BILA|nr:unnamed protein product [Didymodactylos carnosus]CAF4229566.1 unnamed protein product [Didymodactylos carnosus]
MTVLSGSLSQPDAWTTSLTLNTLFTALIMWAYQTKTDTTGEVIETKEENGDIHVSEPTIISMTEDLLCKIVWLDVKDHTQFCLTQRDILDVDHSQYFTECHIPTDLCQRIEYILENERHYREVVLIRNDRNRTSLHVAAIKSFLYVYPRLLLLREADPCAQDRHPELGNYYENIDLIYDTQNNTAAAWKSFQKPLIIRRSNSQPNQTEIDRL